MSHSNSSELQPKQNIQKVLVSTPAHFVGSYQSNVTSIELSFQTSSVLFSRDENPFTRSYMVISFYVEQEYGLGNRILDIDALGDDYCTLLSILYGKEFINHGALEAHGIHQLPNINNPINNLYNYPQYNNNERVDLEIPLDLKYFHLVENIMIYQPLKINPESQRMILTAGKFYNRALGVFPNESELAYLDLITCGEMISNFMNIEYTDEIIYDENLMRTFNKILEIDNGEKIVRDLKKRLFQVKRRFVYALKFILNDSFFENSELTETYNGELGRLNKENIETILKAAYDLRSHYVHSGIQFGKSVWSFHHFNETMIGRPYGYDKTVSKIIFKSPTFIGLERIMRYSLLRIIHNNGLFISEKLN
ncbi:hypothetical protein [Lysinibacillus fusiformis]|uniref:hypothetical protein n=1 Tax=Lysinibacillus fusiformis TaxID=28031 RepID=UPI003D05F032